MTVNSGTQMGIQTGFFIWLFAQAIGFFYSSFDAWSQTGQDTLEFYFCE